MRRPSSSSPSCAPAGSDRSPAIGVERLLRTHRAPAVIAVRLVVVHVVAAATGVVAEHGIPWQRVHAELFDVVRGLRSSDDVLDRRP